MTLFNWLAILIALASIFNATGWIGYGLGYWQSQPKNDAGDMAVLNVFTALWFFDYALNRNR